MTEAGWQECEDVGEMLRYLRREAKVRSPKGRRKLRLFACGCCRQVWPLIEDPRSRQLVELAEQAADGLTDPLELAVAEVAARLAKLDADFASAGLSPMSHIRRVGAAVAAALQTAAKESYEAARVASECALSAVGGQWSTLEPNPAWEAQENRQADLLRDLFGSPFRPATLDLAWLTGQGGTVPQLAEAAYEDRLLPSGHLDPHRLAVLADALTDAGCDNQEILAHLRGPGPHVRGCWVVDLLLGKE
jgi:hypothetical protein